MMTEDPRAAWYGLSASQRPAWHEQTPVYSYPAYPVQVGQDPTFAVIQPAPTWSWKDLAIGAAAGVLAIVVFRRFF